MKKYIRLLITIALLLTAILSTTAFANDDMAVMLEDNPVNFNRIHNGQPLGKPYIENGRTSEDLGYKVTWIQEKQTAVIEKGKIKVEIKIGESTALVNGVRKPIDVRDDGTVVNTKAIIKDSRTYVPVRFIAEAMGEKVEYRIPSNSNVTKLTVYINCKDIPAEKPTTPSNPNVREVTLNEAITNQSEFAGTMNLMGKNPRVFYQNLPVQISDGQPKVVGMDLKDGDYEYLRIYAEGDMRGPQVVFLKGNKMLGASAVTYSEAMKDGSGRHVYGIVAERIAPLIKEADSIGFYHTDKNKLTIVPKSHIKNL